MLEVFVDQEELSRAAAGLFASLAEEAVAARGRFSVLLAGGNTPRRTYELLAQEPLRSRIPWRDLHIFWGDERCVPPGDRRSNAAMAHAALLDLVPIPADQIHPVPWDPSPQAAADRYQSVIAAYFAGAPARFDLALLGLGEDGHTASLLPGSGALTEEGRWVAVTRRSDEEFSRITLTPHLLNQSQVVLFLVTGSGKARVLKAILSGSGQGPPLPAQLIRPRSGQLRWFVDREAAGPAAS